MVRAIEKQPIVDDESDRSNFVRRLGALAEETSEPVEHVSYLISGYWGAENL
jgi:hypothetical protein